MKNIISIISVISVLIIFSCIVLFTLYEEKSSVVFIESVSDTNIVKGMGFVYKSNNNNNYIITNYHVIKDNNNIYVYNLDNKKVNSTLIYYDMYSDIAVLKIDNILDLVDAKIGINNVIKDDFVYYFDIDKYSINKAKVLSLDNKINLSFDYGNSFYNAVSFEGSILEGNSGGPIFNLDGEVIGLISLKQENSNIGFYIPIDNVVGVVTKLENHSLKRPNLGGVFANTTNISKLNEYGITINKNSGVVVLDTIENYSLEKAGIVKGDIIVKINDLEIKDVNDLQNKIHSLNIGDTVVLEYFRDTIINKVDIILN